MNPTNQKPRSTQDVFDYICNAIGGQRASERFMREVLSMLPLDATVIHDITEEEYQWMIHQARTELPYLLYYVLEQDFSHIKLPEFGDN